MDNYQIDGPRGSITIETDTGDATNSRVVPVSQAFIQEMRLAESVPAFLRERGMLQPHERVLTWGPISERWKPTLLPIEQRCDAMISTPPDTGYLPCLLEAGHKGIHETQLDRDELLARAAARCTEMQVSADGIEHRRCVFPAGHAGDHLWDTGPFTRPRPPTAQRLDYLEDREANLAHVVGALEKEHKALVKRLDDVEWNAVARTALSGIETRIDVLENAHAPGPPDKAATPAYGDAFGLRAIAERLRREATGPTAGWDPVPAILKIADRLDGGPGSGLRADISSPGFK